MGTYANQRVRGQIPLLMRRINALEAMIRVFDSQSDYNVQMNALVGGDDDTVYGSTLGVNVRKFDSTGTELDSYSMPGGSQSAGIGFNGSDIYIARPNAGGNRIDRIDLNMDSVAVYQQTASLMTITTSNIYRTHLTDDTMITKLSLTPGPTDLGTDITLANSRENAKPVGFWGGAKLWVQCDDGGSNHYLQRYSASGSFEEEFGPFPTAPDGLVGVSPSGNQFYYVDHPGTNSRIRAVAKDMTVVDDLIFDASFVWTCRSVGVSEDETVFMATFRGATQALYIVKTTSAQTTFYRYPTDEITDKEDLGVPDGGVAIPATTAFNTSSGGAKMRNRWPPIQDMRDAIEALAQHFINDDTGNRFDFDNLSADNLYYKANGETDYNWQAGLVGLARSSEYGLNEVDACITLLESSDLA